MRDGHEVHCRAGDVLLAELKPLTGRGRRQLGATFSGLAPT